MWVETSHWHWKVWPGWGKYIKDFIPDGLNQFLPLHLSVSASDSSVAWGEISLQWGEKPIWSFAQIPQNGSKVLVLGSMQIGPRQSGPGLTDNTCDASCVGHMAPAPKGREWRCQAGPKGRLLCRSLPKTFSMLYFVKYDITRSLGDPPGPDF